MKVIFSRKGFDSSAGKKPSPIVGGRPISMPIPTHMPSPTTYGDLARGVGQLVHDLTGGRIRPEHRCHLDPDIDDEALPRKEGWRGSFGQVAASQAHLAKNFVSEGDLFLFFGLFRPAIKESGWRFTGRKEHRLFGWLQVGEVMALGSDGRHALMSTPE